MRYTPNEKAVTNFNFASHGGQGQDGKGLTTWYRVTCWGELAEGVNQKVSKGDHLSLGGYLQPPRAYLKKDKATGKFLKDANGDPVVGASLEFTAFSFVALEYAEVDLFPREPVEEKEAVPCP